MNVQRASATNTTVLGPIYERPERPDTLHKASNILALARVGVAASDSALNIDLVKQGYGELLETIARLASDILDMQPGFEPEEKGGSDEQA
ncbi:hypothetical protein [Ruegeria jejuensis]|uniref:hypothetical protein n=1 Tax=Ruegeria jejuensis TaxID=3233338 RepID=UPI00355C7DBC